MSTSPKPKETRRVVEGIFAINKPQWQTSAGVLRDLNTHFDKSPLFAPWLDFTRRNMILSNAKKRNIDNLKVKLGHGGTLDPLATGVLIVGVGKGTKCLQRFLDCTKTYETVVLFGAATDTYDAVGKVVSRAPYEHVTEEVLEKALEQFRGKIMQKPSVFSALKVDGKKMYEYARAGGDIPEVQARPVEVKELKILEWYEPGTHEYEWPKEEIKGVEKVGAQKLMGVKPQDAPLEADDQESRGLKRPRDEEPEEDDTVSNIENLPKKPKTADEPAMSGALPVEQDSEAPQPRATENEANEDRSSTDLSTEPKPKPPAARLRMTVTSGFYVRSLCHDLGLALNSHGLMSSLIRTRQGDYSLASSNPNVLEYADLEAGPETWEPKVQGFLEEFMEKEGWEAEEVEDEESWQANRKERESERQEGDRERSYKGGGKREGKWRGKGGGGHGGGRKFYSKDMSGRDYESRERDR
ncbi:pseudouridine synthase [Lophiotrema nucula]|uniref:tRNA pseudouridine(55) synthase n=1 Tax=Lophiotrema nucula TaxID=690887 RepID=A0A6A5YZM0_9PLEO|nr:pseudouridine synthase [Lophiotrema nucula]